MKDREIKGLRAELQATQPVKRKKVRQDPNKRFIRLAEIASQRVQQPAQPIPILDTIIVATKDIRVEIAKEVIIRRSNRLHIHSARYLFIQSDSEDEED